MKIEQSKLAIFINSYFYLLGEEYYTDDNIILFHLWASENFKKILIFAPISHNVPPKENLYKINDKRIEIIALPHYSGKTYELLRTGHKVIPALLKTLKSLRSGFDILWQIDCPNPLNLVFNFYCRRMNIPIVFFIRQEMTKGLRVQYRGVMKYVLIIASQIIDIYNRRLMRYYPTFVVGDKLYASYKKRNNFVYKITHSLFSEGNIVNYSEVAKKELGDCLRILVAGRLEKVKGIIFLLRAIEALTRQHNLNIHVTIIGSGAEEIFLKAYLRKRNIEKYVSIEGFMKHGKAYFEYFKNADLFIQSSLSEGVPKGILEAMAYGLPLIVSRVGGMTYLVKDGINGLTVNPGSAEDIVRAILKYKRNTNLLKKFALYNLQYVKQFVFERQKCRILKVIRGLQIK